MRMVPNYLLHTKSGAEKRVFDKLQAAMNDTGDMWYAFHSLNLPHHRVKRFGEADFVVCGPGGLFVLEIKGGRISCKDGAWGTTDRHDNYSPLREPPYTQAEGALHALAETIDKSLLERFVRGYGVVTPDCSMKDIASAEWDKAIWADIKDVTDFEKWFKSLVKHWTEVATRQYSPSPASPEAVKELVMRLRPDFETATPLFDRVSLAEDRIATLTEDQLKVVDIIADNPRVICKGGAGTGKTFLAVELAQRWAASGLQVALVCYSPWLKRYIDCLIPPGVTVAQFDALGVTARRAGVQTFDAMIIDEGQDLLNFASLETMDSFLAGGLKGGHWCFFHDSNNQAGVLGNFEPEALRYLSDMVPASIPLTKNCRNTSQILTKIQSTLGVDMGNDSVGNGPEVIEKHVANGETVGGVLEREIKTLLQDGSFTVDQIVILSPNSFKDSGAFELRSSTRLRVSEMDSFSPGTARTTIGFAAIPNFKGLESEVVFLIDMPKPGGDHDTKTLQYIGMSRARALLYMIY